VSDLSEIAKKLLVSGKGLLAADWGVSSVGKRFEKIGLENSQENRRRYREMLFTTQGLEEYISGVIEFEETVKQKTGAGIPFPEVLSKKGILPGVKVDRGLAETPDFPGEKITEGIEGLKGRLVEYKNLGAVFCKWRSVVVIGQGLPTGENISANSHLLAKYAVSCQELGMVPIVEPEVLMDGDHTIDKCVEVTEMTHRILFQTLADYKVDLEGLILKTNMAVSGKECPTQARSEEIAQETVAMLRRTVPVNIPGIVFLSGGQDAPEATKNLNAIAKIKDLPWKLTFSFERALEEPTLFAWEGKSENTNRAQAVLLHRAKMNSLASRGEYYNEEEKGADI
jgi:fructose-bisphosphate aldolase class I